MGSWAPPEARVDARAITVQTWRETFSVPRCRHAPSLSAPALWGRGHHPIFYRGYKWPEIWQRVLSTWSRQVGELASLVAPIRLAVLGGLSSPGGKRAANIASLPCQFTFTEVLLAHVSTKASPWRHSCRLCGLSPLAQLQLVVFLTCSPDQQQQQHLSECKFSSPT